MMDITHEQLLQSYRQQLSDQDKVGSKKSDEDPIFWSYLMAASVLSSFMPERLKPLDTTLFIEQPRLLLFDHITSLPGGISEGLFTLKLSSRKLALDRLHTRENMLKALNANSNRIVDDLQQIWERYLKTGKFRELNDYSYRDLMNIDQILSWIPDGLEDRYPREAVAALLKRKSVLLDFEHLCTADFTGREKELKIFERHSTNRYISILSVFGPGGIGKSALIGQFLSMLAKSDITRHLFAYLAFDQPNLRIETPYTILVEIVLQLRKQHPRIELYSEYFMSAVERYRNQEFNILSKTLSYESRGIRMGTIARGEEEIYREFNQLMGKLVNFNSTRNRVIIVLDTFEEVQYRDRESLGKFWGMLEFLAYNMESISVIISGRSSISHSQLDRGIYEELNIGKLETEDQLIFLSRLGITDSNTALAISEKVGGSPLSLKLAADLVKRQEEDGVEFINHSIAFQIDEEIIQGQLYRRILDHIHDDRVRVLAHPGMVLRIINPELIMLVLASICKIKIDDIHQATVLYSKLREEHTLVRTSESGLLQYRPEVRNAMIRLLTQDRYSDVKQIHRAAINYYYTRNSDSTEERAEEIYHRLVLDNDSYELLDQRWLPGIEKSIISNLEEYSDRIKVWLASRLSLEISRDTFADADISDWERNITRKAKQALLSADLDEATSLLRERSERSENSPLFAIEAKVAILADQLNHAQVIIIQGLSRLATSGNGGRIAELHWLDAQIYIYQGKYKMADHALGLAEQSIKHATSKIPLIQVLCHRIMLLVQLKKKENAIVVLREKLNTALLQVNDRVPYFLEFIPQMGLAFLAQEYPKTKEKLSAYIDAIPDYEPDYDMLRTESLRGLEEYRESWENEGDHNMLFESYT